MATSKAKFLNIAAQIFPIVFSAAISVAAVKPIDKPDLSRTVASFDCRECNKANPILGLPNEFSSLIDIIGADDRRKVSESEELLFSGVGKTVCRNSAISNSTGVGTASLVGSRATVLTVSHNFWHFGADGSKTRFDPINDCVFQLVDRDNNVFFESRFERIKAGKQFEADVRSEHSDDWAVLRLARPAPNAVSYYGYSVLKQGLTPGKKYPVRIASFQKANGDTPREKMTQDICHFWVAENDSLDIHGREIHHDCDALPGSSGASLIFERADGSKVVMGINNRDGDVGQSTYNRAVKISDEIFSTLQSFSSEVIATTASQPVSK